MSGNRKERLANAKAAEKLTRKLGQEPKEVEFNLDPNALQAVGIILVTNIHIAAPHEALLKAAGRAVPPPITARLLVDTGATKTLVRHEIAEKAGLRLISADSPIHGIGVDTSGRTYLGRVAFSVESKVNPGTQHMFWVDTEIASGSLPVAHIDGLIGRDVLRHFELTVNGNTGKFRMRFLSTARPVVVPLPQQA